MSKHFTPEERFSILNAYNFFCFWCPTPTALKMNTSHIDHIIPQSMLNDKTKLDNIKKQYGLPDTFEINSFENWVPSCPGCNTFKNANLLENCPAAMSIFQYAKTKAKDARITHEKLITQQKYDKLLTQLEMGIVKGTITQTEVLYIIKKYETELNIILKENLPDDRIGDYQLRDKWRIQSYDDNDFIIVTDGHMTGITPKVGKLDNSDLCPTCHKYGPWSNYKCLSCGHFKEPD